MRQIRASKREAPLGRDTSEFELLSHPAGRSQTEPWLRTDIKARFAAIRESLSPDARMLLLLRVDRNLPWNDIARVMLPAEPQPSSTEIAQKAAMLRKQFERLKQKLRELAGEAGLLSPQDGSDTGGR